MKNLDYDYHKLDKLSVSLNSVITEEILICYRALGWQQAQRQQDSQFGNVEHFDFFRPHDIRGKDRLQLLQVHMETEVNDLARATVNKHALSFTLGISAGILGLALIVWGILAAIFYYPASGPKAIVWDVLMGVLGVALLVVCGIFTYKTAKWETARYEEKVRRGLELIDKVYREAYDITEGCDYEITNGDNFERAESGNCEITEGGNE